MCNNNLLTWKNSWTSLKARSRENKYNYLCNRFMHYSLILFVAVLNTICSYAPVRLYGMLAGHTNIICRSFRTTTFARTCFRFIWTYCDSNIPWQHPRGLIDCQGRGYKNVGMNHLLGSLVGYWVHKMTTVLLMFVYMICLFCYSHQACHRGVQCTSHQIQGSISYTRNGVKVGF